ncbi:hypothetical protein BJ165DRAFT_1519843, partial [Panaeolus papilionaceus]
MTVMQLSSESTSNLITWVKRPSTLRAPPLIRIGKTSRFTLYYADRVWGIIIPDACLEAEELEIGNLESPQVVVIARFPPEYAEFHTISRFCAYRHVLLCPGERNRLILAEFAWPDDALLVSEGGVQEARYITPVTLRMDWKKSRRGDDNAEEEEELNPIQMLFTPAPLLALDEVSGQIAVYHRGAGYLVGL